MDKALKRNFRCLVQEKKVGTILGYYVMDPERFGVVSIDKEGRAVDIEEKPKNKIQLCIHRALIL